MALACRHTGARCVHLSTDYVLDGRRPGLKDEATRCRPVNWYGESKREGELQVLEALPTAVVARVSWVCGNPQKPSFVESTLARALAGQPLAAVADKESLPTDAADIARAVLALGEGEYAGVVHVCSSGQPLSWWHCAQLALQAAVEQGALGVLPPVEQQKLDEVPFFREPRPRYTGMSNARLTTQLGIPMPTVQQTIGAVVQRYLAAVLP
jgi:dTDP-4-dehydrorhamnose reductase